MRRRGKTLEVSTFPFLAVLLCAMGSLILVLLVMDRKAKLAARYKATAAQTQAAAELATADAARRDLAQQRERDAQAAWDQKRDKLHTAVVSEQQALLARQKAVSDQLADAAARLKAELDDSATLKKRVEGERVRLAGDEKVLATTRQDVTQAVAQSAAERAAQEKMTADVVQLEIALKNLKEARERDRQTYSVVPYRGKHGESRRPLYVECTNKGVIFHPERIDVAVGSDPTAARAEVERRVKRQREYLASIQAQGDDKPYLMLLVRPDGISSYYALQKAVAGLDLEFGYEFVDAAWVFDFTKDADGAPLSTPIATASPAAASPLVIGRVGPAVAGGLADTGNAPGTHPDDGLGATRPGFPTTPGSGNVGKGSSEVAGGSNYPPGAVAGTNSAAPPVGGVAGPALGVPGPPASGLVGPAGPAVATAPALVPPGLPPTTRTGAGGTSGIGASPAGNGPSLKPSLPIVSPTAPPVGGATKAPARMDPPYRPGKTSTDFASQGEHHATPAPGTGGQGTAAPPAVISADGIGKATPAGTPGSPASTGSHGPNPNGSAPTKPAANVEKDAAPKFAPTEAPPTKKPQPLRVARLSGDRDYVIFIECRPDDVVLFPARQAYTVQKLQHGDQALLEAVKQMIDKRQSLVRPGELPFRPQVRFLVHPESIRSYHAAYPILNALGVPQTRQNLEADDDVAAIVVGQ